MINNDGAKGSGNMGARDMERSIGVLIADADAAERERLKGLLAGEAYIQVIAEAASGRECLELAARHRPDIALVKQGLPDFSGVDTAERLSAEVPECGAILILTGQEPEEVWHKMLRAGIKEFLTEPISKGKLVPEICKVADLQNRAPTRKIGEAKPAVAVPEESKSKIITIAGPRGGCGKTTLATNLAVALAQEGEETVALVDLNLWGGDVSLLMDMTPRRTLGDLLPGFGGIDYDVVDSLMVKHPTGVSVLAAPLTGTFDGATLSRYTVQSILEALRDHYSAVVVDTGYPNLESTLAAMDCSDVIVVVVSMDLPRLRDGKQYLKSLLNANYPKDKIRVVVNRSTASKEISMTEAESILEFAVTAYMPNDEVLVRSSINLGQPFVNRNPHRPLSKSVLTLARGFVSPNAEAEGARKRKSSRWLAFLHLGAGNGRVDNDEVN
jgi:pilus assembly protein CpaE